MVHPDRDHAISQKEKLRQAAAPPAQPQQQGQWPPWIAGASTPFQTGAPYPQQAQYPWLHMQPQLGTQTNPAASAAMAQWKENQAFLNRTGNTMQSMIASLDHFMTYLKHGEVTAFTDHMPLVKLSNKDRNTMNALHQKLAEMHLTLIHHGSYK